MTGSPPDFDWVTASPAGPDGALRLELAVARASAASAPDPFVPLSATGRLSRVLLARTSLDAATPTRWLAVKLPKDVFRLAVRGVGGAPLGNAAIDAMWTRERLDGVAMRGPGAVAPLAVCDSGPWILHRPTARLFRPLCPIALTPLRTCRDDEVLRGAGLEPYSTSTVRYLWAGDAAAARKGTGRTFYTWSEDAGHNARSGVTVRRRGELFLDGVELLQRGVPDDVLQRLEAEHPVWLAAHRGADAARPADGVVPLCFYDSTWLVFDALPLGFGELIDLLGGATAARTLADAGDTAGRMVFVPALREALERPRQWLFAAEGGRRFALEVLHLKLTAFGQLLAGVVRMHERCRRPHLALALDNVLAELGPSGAGLPARWAFDVRLADFGSAIDVAGGTNLPELLLPIADVASTFQSPFADPANRCHEAGMQLSIVRRDAKGGVVSLRARTTGARLLGPRPGDRVRVAPRASLPGTGDATLDGVVTSITAGGCDLSIHLEDSWRAHADALPASFHADCSFDRCLRAPCDLFGLGMLLARCLLANDSRDMFGVEDVVRAVLDQLELRGHEAEGGDAEFWAANLRRSLEQHGDAFSSEAVLFDRGAREANPDPIPDDLWHELLGIVFRLTSTSEGFAFAAYHDACDPKAPHRVVAAVADELRSVARRIEIELFAAERRSREIAALCQRMSLEIGSALVGGGGQSHESGPDEFGPDEIARGGG